MRTLMLLMIVAAGIWTWAADRQGWMLTPVCRYFATDIERTTTSLNTPVYSSVDGHEFPVDQYEVVRLRRRQAEFDRDCTAIHLWGWHRKLGW